MKNKFSIALVCLRKSSKYVEYGYLIETNTCQFPFLLSTRKTLLVKWPENEIGTTISNGDEKTRKFDNWTEILKQLRKK